MSVRNIAEQKLLGPFCVVAAFIILFVVLLFLFMWDFFALLTHRYITCTEYTNFYGGKRAGILYHYNLKNIQL